MMASPEIEQIRRAYDEDTCDSAMRWMSCAPYVASITWDIRSPLKSKRVKMMLNIILALAPKFNRLCESHPASATCVGKSAVARSSR
ncbi:MAG: hypothetical protein ETSY1_06875 [Candidatus Entotheonella factor]|uniref:Uncharacterized protein n=1 Tax=Entotheonella factor TaxID=1429438 RepID=W4LU23_ENTF1|nr:MAG: hypothetical protein ETSY1_06875 [Candidatus Entotheonella factor]